MEQTLSAGGPVQVSRAGTGKISSSLGLSVLLGLFLGEGGGRSAVYSYEARLAFLLSLFQPGHVRALMHAFYRLWPG